MKQIVKGLKNSQRIMVILDGIGFRTTVKEVPNMVFASQSNAVLAALTVIAMDEYVGYSARIKSYDNKMKALSYDVQVTLTNA